MFWKKKPTLEYPSVNQFREAILKKTLVFNASEEDDYQVALGRVRQELKLAMWEGKKHLTFSCNRTYEKDTRLRGPINGWDWVSAAVRDRVGNTLVEELTDLGFTASYQECGDGWHSVRVGISDV